MSLHINGSFCLKKPKKLQEENQKFGKVNKIETSTDAREAKAKSLPQILKGRKK